MIRISSIKFMNTGNDSIPSDKEEYRKYLTDNLKRKCAKLLRISVDEIQELTIVKHSIDARKKPEIFDLYTVDIRLKKEKSEEKIVKQSGCKNASVTASKKYVFPAGRNSYRENKRKTRKPFRPVIVGAGPAGLFCAYELALAGYCPIVLERGMDVDKRSEMVESFWKGGPLLERTNVQFGEGGAGTFSDGKLNTMVKDKAGRNQRSLEIFVENGADPNILYEAKPHIGTDVLRKVVKNIREKIIERGGEFFFESKVTDILLENQVPIDSGSDSKEIKIAGVRCEDGREFISDAVVLAIGHSARDTFGMLNGKNVKMEQKPFAVGLRVEHPQALINESQYGHANPTSLPPSPYKVTAQTPSGHGVYSFCMCPGGYVVNASSEEGRLCVNGMSYSGRDSSNANSAIIVTVDTKDFGSDDVLAGVEFQRRLEEKAYEVGQGKIPVEYFDDYKEGIRTIENGSSDDTVLTGIREHEDSGRNKPCMKGDYTFAPVHRILPVSLGCSIVYGMEQFGRMIKGFDGDDALLSGVEARTSSPVRILRDENLEAVDIEGLYPCGEGAGYAGGITSAAIDGIKTAEQIAIHYFSGKDEIRNLLIKKRRELTSSTKKELDLSITEKVITSEEYEKAENILIFCNMKDEADTAGMIDDALKKGKKVFCPKVIDKASHRMEFIKICSLSDLREGAYGISEPTSTDERDYFKEQKDNTLMIMPGLCFDRHGNRLGFGAGYYDRFINRFLDAFKNGIMKSTAIGYNFQLTDDFLDEFMDRYDMTVDMIITDKEIVRL